MLKQFLAGAAVALALAVTPACAQTAPAAAAATDADPALWVVKDADTTMYLFGTVHVLKPGLTWFDEAVKTAFDGSDTLVLELIEPDPGALQKIAVAKGFNPTGPTLSSKLPAEKRAGVAKALGEVGLPEQVYERMDPWMAAVTLAVAPLAKLGYDPNSGAEKVLAASAKTGGKQIVGLETAEQQLGFFDALSEPAQVGFLVSTVDDLPEVPVEMNRMVTSWAKGDPETLGTILNDNLKDSPEVGKLLLTDRNARWAEWIETRMAKPGTVFVAVGAGHLAGAGSVQAQLAARGLKAERVKY